MARVGRLAGALLAHTEDSYFLVGNLKAPCDFVAAGFAQPAGEVDATVAPYTRLQAQRQVDVGLPCLELAVEGEALAQLLAQRLLIHRNGSVSERLWNLLGSGQAEETAVPARWLGEISTEVWDVVRDAVLRCS